MAAVFVTGTDTHVGKTITSAWLCQHWQAQYWKPIQSGLDGPTDRSVVATLAQVNTHPEAALLRAPLSPHLAAARENKTLSLAQFTLPAAPRLVVEGAGGCCVPINMQHTMLHLMQHLGLPALLVARSSLGTINHSLLSIQALHAAHIPVLGVIVVGPHNFDNCAAIEHFGKVPILAELPHWPTPNHHALAQYPMPALLQNALQKLS
jgi:dethiobiotin synthetase/malonyl-CoA O-methyltransferase